MSKMKIYEYANKIDKKAKELVNILLENGVEVKSHMSVIDEKGVEIINKHYGIEKPKKSEEPANPRMAARLGSARPASVRSAGTATVAKKEVEKDKKARKAEKEKAKDVVAASEDNAAKNAENTAATEPKAETKTETKAAVKEAEVKRNKKIKMVKQSNI